MRRWRICMGAMGVSALLAAGSLATPIVDREGGTAPAAATDLAAASAARGVLDASGEVGDPSLDTDPSLFVPPALLPGPTLIPEPTTIVLVSLGMAGLAFSGRRRA
jgi:PEP-CTERM motif